MEEDLQKIIRNVGTVAIVAGRRLKTPTHVLGVSELQEIHTELGWCQQAIEQVVNTHIQRSQVNPVPP